MHKYTLNTNTCTIHIYEDLHYNPNYGIAKARDDDQATGCNDFPSKHNAKNLGPHRDMNGALEMAKAHHDTPRFCLKCFGTFGGMLNRLSRNAY